MSTPEVERAAEVMHAQAPKLGNESHYDCDRRYAAALSAAGLLRTEADRLNAELAEAMVAYCETYGFRTGITLERDGPARDRVGAAIVAILDSRKPKERWTVGRTSSLGVVWAMRDGANAVGFPSDAEPEARAYVARKNAAERAK